MIASYDSPRTCLCLHRRKDALQRELRLPNQVRHILGQQRRAPVESDLQHLETLDEHAQRAQRVLAERQLRVHVSQYNSDEQIVQRVREQRAAEHEFGARIQNGGDCGRPNVRMAGNNGKCKK